MPCTIEISWKNNRGEKANERNNEAIAKNKLMYNKIKKRALLEERKGFEVGHKVI